MRLSFFRSTGLYPSLLAAVMLILSPFKAPTSTAQTLPDAPRLDSSEKSLDLVQQRMAALRSGTAEQQALRETMVDGRWDLLVAENDGEWSDQAFFDVVLEISITEHPESPMVDLKAAYSFDRLDRRIVVGTVTEPSGKERHLLGVAVDLGSGLADQSGHPIRLFTPLLPSSDLAWLEGLAKDMVAAHDLAALQGFQNGASMRPPTVEGLSLLKNQDTCSCEADYEQAMWQIEQAIFTCMGGVPIMWEVCLGVCPLTGPGAVPCLTACLGAGAALFDICLLLYIIARAEAESDRSRCLDECVTTEPPGHEVPSDTTSVESVGGGGGTEEGDSGCSHWKCTCSDGAESYFDACGYDEAWAACSASC